MREDIIDVLRIGLLPKDYSVALEETALIVIDMQTYQTRASMMSQMFSLFDPEMPTYYLERVTEIVEPNILKLLAVFRAADRPVIFTKILPLNDEDGGLPVIWKQLNAMAREQAGAPIFPNREDVSTELNDNMPRDAKDIIIEKTTSSGFVNTSLNSVLKEKNIKRIILCGVISSICVESTARGGFDYGYDVTVIDDACGAPAPQLHASAMAAIEISYGNVRMTDEYIAEVQKGLNK